MAFVMIAFRVNAKQRKWLGIPIGMFLYLFLDRAGRKPIYSGGHYPDFQINKADAPTWEDPAILVLME